MRENYNSIYLKISGMYFSVLRAIKDKQFEHKYKEFSQMKINIICPEERGGWILGKFGQCVYMELKKMGIDVELTQMYDEKADINHYFYPMGMGMAGYPKMNKGTTFMITHVDTAMKLARVKELTEKGAIGICMSRATWEKLSANGIKRNRICYINPAQDGQIKPRKVVLGFTNRIYSDNRKKDSIILDVCNKINPELFKFKIMGAGWSDIVSAMRELSFEVEYYDNFDKKIYSKLIPSLDYYCYFGFDEGAMGYLDAVAAGIGTIVTPQGYHLDTGIPITYPVNTIDDILDALYDIGAKKEKAIRFAETWTWKKYAEKHLEIWKYILNCESLDVLLQNRGYYIDGIFSLLLDDLNNYKSLSDLIEEKANFKQKNA